MCEAKEDSKEFVYILLAVIAVVLFIGIIYNIQKINPLKLFQVLPGKHGHLKV